MSWRDHEDKTLVEMWRDGHSADEIGRRIGGKSRSAVLGRVHRLRAKGASLQHRPTRVTEGARRLRKVHQRHWAPINPKANVGRAAPLRRPLRVLEALPPPVVVLKSGEVEPNGQPASLMEICAAACRWAVTGGPPHSFCNKIRRAGSAYCDEHTLKSFQHIQPPDQKLGKTS